MILTSENILLIGSVLLFFSVIAGKTSYRFGIPTLLFFIVVGILAGSDGILKIQFDDPKLAQIIGIIALNFILFSGGLSTDFGTVKPVFWQGLSLSTLGVLVTAILTGVFIHLLTQLSFLDCLLLGSIVSSTDSAAVFSILRSKGLSLKDNLRPLLEFESGSNDPMAYILTITLLTFLSTGGQTIMTAVVGFLMQLIIGGVMGYLIGRLAIVVINRIKLEYEGLNFVLLIAIMFFSFSFTNLCRGNGFLSVYLTGLIVGNKKFLHKRTILKIFDGFGWLMQVIMFLTLGLLVNPSEMISVWQVGLVVSVFMMLFARPIAVFFSTALFKIGIRSRLFISWVGLKGAVPIVFATYPFIAAHPDSNTMFNIVFFISTISLIIQGSSIPYIAKILRVEKKDEHKYKGTFDKFINEDDNSVIKEFIIYETSPAINKSLVELQLPRNALLAVIMRDNKYIIPEGQTTIQAGDLVMLIAEDKDSMHQAWKILN